MYAIQSLPCNREFCDNIFLSFTTDQYISVCNFLGKKKSLVYINRSFFCITVLWQSDQEQFNLRRKKQSLRQVKGARLVEHLNTTTMFFRIHIPEKHINSNALVKSFNKSQPTTRDTVEQGILFQLVESRPQVHSRPKSLNHHHDVQQFQQFKPTNAAVKFFLVGIVEDT